MILAGTKIIPKVGALGSVTKTSIASILLRKIPLRSPVGLPTFIENKAGQIVFRTTTSVGGFVARWVPVIGWGFTSYDIWTSDVRKAFSLGAQDYLEIQRQAQVNPLLIVCFTEGTLVYAKNGLKSIELINVGDSVYTFNLRTLKIELGKVVRTFAKDVQELYTLTTTSQNINVTAEHPFYVIDKEWIPVKELKHGDKFKTIHNSSEEVKSSQVIKKSVTVYNIKVDGNHNYFVTNGYILVHNK
jgi:hypothetical protein